MHRSPLTPFSARLPSLAKAIIKAEAAHHHISEAEVIARWAYSCGRSPASVRLIAAHAQQDALVRAAISIQSQPHGSTFQSPCK